MVYDIQLNVNLRPKPILFFRLELIGTDYEIIVRRAKCGEDITLLKR